MFTSGWSLSRLLKRITPNLHLNLRFVFRFKMEIQDNTRMRTDYLTGATGKKLNKENLRDNISIKLGNTDENYKGSGQNVSSMKSRGNTAILSCVK